MQKIFLVILSISILLCSDVFGFTGGSGIATDPYQISTPNDLEEVNNYLSSSFVLLNDIDLSDKIYAMAVISPDIINANSGHVFDGIPFTGTFDGVGFTITGLIVDDNDLEKDYIGLFGCIGDGGLVKDLNLKNINIVGSDDIVGGLCGMNYGSIINCHLSGYVSGRSSWTGGVCGLNKGSILNCYSSCHVAGETYVGGICGANYEGVIESCGSKSTISNIDHKSYSKMGGICGDSGSTVINCYFVGNIEVDQGGESVGGICGDNGFGEIINCYSTGNIDGGIYMGRHVGGICGLNNNGGKVINCYATGIIKGDIYVGGLCGLNSDRYTIIQDSYSNTEVLASFGGVGGFCGGNGDFASIVNCYSMGQVIGGHYVGGLCGFAYYRASITGCYSVAEIMLPGPYYGGICGYQKDRCIIENCYFLSGTAPDNGYGTVLSDDEMKLKSSFVGWDFVSEDTDGYEDTWRMCVDGIDYPHFWWEFSVGDITCNEGVDFTDFAVLAANWLSDDSSEGWYNNADLDFNGQIDVADLMLLSENWLANIE